MDDNNKVYIPDWFSDIINFKVADINKIVSNDATDNSSLKIFDDMLLLKRHIMKVLPSVRVFLSCPILRTDNAKAMLTLRVLTRKLKLFNNDIIDPTCLGKASLHLNRKGSGRLATNFLSLLRNL